MCLNLSASNETIERYIPLSKDRERSAWARHNSNSGEMKITTKCFSLTVWRALSSQSIFKVVPWRSTSTTLRGPRIFRLARLRQRKLGINCTQLKSPWKQSSTLRCCQGSSSSCIHQITCLTRRRRSISIAISKSGSVSKKETFHSSLKSYRRSPQESPPQHLRELTFQLASAKVVKVVHNRSSTWWDWVRPLSQVIMEAKELQRRCTNERRVALCRIAVYANRRWMAVKMPSKKITTPSWSKKRYKDLI